MEFSSLECPLIVNECETYLQNYKLMNQNFLELNCKYFTILLQF